MNRLEILKAALIASAAVLLSANTALATNFNIPAGDLKSALAAYMTETGVELIYPEDQMGGSQTKGVAGALAPEDALARILKGTGFSMRHELGAIAIVRDRSSQNTESDVSSLQLAQAVPSRAAVETVTVTSSKLGGADVQNIPIAITALSQEHDCDTNCRRPGSCETSAEPDVLQDEFHGLQHQIRGIGTQAISVTTDPAVAVALNDIPFIRNHFFEQEFYDLGQAEVLRGPQGTLYGRNATAGVVNLITAKPTDQFEAMASADLGNYHQRRFEGMINLPIVDDRVDLRVAGEWTKRQGYSFNEITDQRIDGRDLWSGRVTLGFNPTENLKTTLVWEHFSEDDDRMRTGKQLCKTAEPPTSIGGQPVPPGLLDRTGALTLGADYLSQGCEATSLVFARSIPSALWIFTSLCGWRG